MIQESRSGGSRLGIPGLATQAPRGDAADGGTCSPLPARHAAVWIGPEYCHWLALKAELISASYRPWLQNSLLLFSRHVCPSKPALLNPKLPTRMDRRIWPCSRLPMGL